MRDPILIQKYRVLDHDLAQLSNKLHGNREFETQMFVPDKAHCKIAQAEINKLYKRIEEIAAPDDVFTLLKLHFKDFLDAQQLFLDRMSEGPAYMLRGMTYQLSDFDEDSRDDDIKAEVLVKRAQQLPGFLSALLAECEAPDQLSDLHRNGSNLKKTYEELIEKLPGLFPSYCEKKVGAIADTIKNLCAELGQWLDAVKAKAGEENLAPAGGHRPETAVLPQNIEEYRRVLRDDLGVDLDELLEWHESELEKTRNECFRLAAELDIPESPAKNMREVNDILFKYEGPASSAEEMYERANAFIKRTRAAAHECVWLPEDESCEVRHIPEEARSTNPWGGYGGGCQYRRPMKGHMFLNQYNYKAITDGWIKINTLHEAYPGHHVQWVRRMTDQIPETFKLGAKGVPLSEGTCIRTERVFEKRVFSEDIFYPLFVAYRRHHGAVRIKVDLWLRYFGKSIGDAVRLYEEEMGLDHESARMQVQAHENDYGYFTCYYYGLKKLEEWEKEYGYEQLPYTALLFDVGEVSIDNFGRFLKLSEEDKYSLTHDFGSLYQFK